MDQSRRNLLGLCGTMAAGMSLMGCSSSLKAAAAPSGNHTERTSSMRNDSVDAYAFGAKGDGKTDCTAALQSAIDKADGGGTVYIPAGHYLTNKLTLRKAVCLMADPTWAYRGEGGTLLKLIDENAPALIDATGAIGASIYGLHLKGTGKGGAAHGIMIDKPYYGVYPEEDTLRIDYCKIGSFAGDAIHLNRIWVCSIRHSYCSGCRNGVFMRGVDVFAHDNWFSANREAGFGAYARNDSVIISSNRIEWNRRAGIALMGGKRYTITGNCFDRAGGAGLALVSRKGIPCEWIVVTGNEFYRGGFNAKTPEENTHILLDAARGITVTGNVFCAWCGDTNWKTSAWGPDYGITYRALENCSITGNTLHAAAAKSLFNDLGGEHTRLEIANNAGSITKPYPVDQYDIDDIVEW